MLRTPSPLFLALLLSACAHAPAPAAAPRAAAASSLPHHRSFEELPAVDVPPLDFRLTPAQLTDRCQAAERLAQARVDGIAAMNPDALTFEDTFGALETARADLKGSTERLAFLSQVHPDAAVREAASHCEEDRGKLVVRLLSRRDVYRALRAYVDGRGQRDALAPADRRLIFRTLQTLRRNGLDLPDDKLAQLVKIRSRIAELESRFGLNLANNTDSIEATPAELKGLPESLLARLKHAPDGKLILTTKYPDYFPVEEESPNEALRRRMMDAFNAREAKANLPIMKELVQLRHQMAQLLGYPSYADYQAEPRMARSAKAIADFLDRLRVELRPGLERLNAQMLALKRKDTHDPHATLGYWDYQYYLKRLIRSRFAIDDEQVRTYFPTAKVLAGMFHVYEKLLHLSIQKVPHADVWAPDVELYEIHDADGGKLLAKFYLDLYPRPGKYGHAASFDIGPPGEVAAGYQIPLNALVANFSPPRPGPSYLSFEEVETLFHEFGHIVHQSLTSSPYGSIGGSNVATDFVEAPSQMMQNMVYRPEVLRLISADPKDPARPLPDALAARIDRARTFDKPMYWTRQVFLATLDQRMHTDPNVDPDALDHQLRPQFLGYAVDPQDHFVATFGHLADGYDAGYYGYAWSLVVAQDLFTRFEQQGVLSPAVGRDYRDDILAPGDLEDPEALVHRFLRRDSNEKAFLRLMGLGDAVSVTKAAAR